VSSASDLQPLNTWLPIPSAPPLITAVLIDEQSLNAYSPIVFTVSGTVMLVIPLHPENAP